MNEFPLTEHELKYLPPGVPPMPALPDGVLGGDEPHPDFVDLPPRPLRLGVVYYALRLGDGAVKIGWSAGLSARMRGLVRDFGPMELLATEPGTTATEDERHARFARLRMPAERPAGGTEFFHSGPALVRHIKALRTAAAVAA